MKRVFFGLVLSLICLTVSYAQVEQAPMLEKEISYKDWNLKSVRDDSDVNLRDLTRGKKLVMVVYFAPWCHDWRFDAPIVQRLYDKYKGDGLEVVGVGEYDPVASMKNNLDFLKITFPVAYESVNRTDKQKTKHYDYRRSVDDTRSWGSPWYLFLEQSQISKKGDTLVKKAHVINGEMIVAEAEKYIREQLGLPAEVTTNATTATNKKPDTVEVCDPAKATELKVAAKP